MDKLAQLAGPSGVRPDCEEDGYYNSLLGDADTVIPIRKDVEQEPELDLEEKKYLVDLKKFKTREDKRKLRDILNSLPYKGSTQNILQFLFGCFGKKKVIMPSTKAIEVAAKVGTRQVRGLLKKIEDAGFLLRYDTHRWNKAKNKYLQTSNTYYFTTLVILNHKIESLRRDLKANYRNKNKKNLSKKNLKFLEKEEKFILEKISREEKKLEAEKAELDALPKSRSYYNGRKILGKTVREDIYLGGPYNKESREKGGCYKDQGGGEEETTRTSKGTSSDKPINNITPNTVCNISDSFEEGLSNIFKVFEQEFETTVSDQEKIAFKNYISSKELSYDEILRRIDIFSNDIYLKRSTKFISRVSEHFDTACKVANDLKPKAISWSDFTGEYRVNREALSNIIHFFKTEKEIFIWAKSPLLKERKCRALAIIRNSEAIKPLEDSIKSLLLFKEKKEREELDAYVEKERQEELRRMNEGRKRVEESEDQDKEEALRREKEREKQTEVKDLSQEIKPKIPVTTLLSNLILKNEAITAERKRELLSFVLKLSAEDREKIITFEDLTALEKKKGGFK